MAPWPSGKAEACKAFIPSSNLGGASSSLKAAKYASVAQLVEQGTENPRVIGSIPIGGTNMRT